VATTRVGSTKKFSAGWDRAFAGEQKAAMTKAAKPKRARTKKTKKKTKQK
jgi:hypothetical protein